VFHTIEQYANNPVEADHGRLKARLRPMRGLKRHRSARILAAGQAFVQNLRRSEDDRAFVHTLIDLAQRLRLDTVAEWVQDEDTAEILAAWGCDYIQGALVGLASTARPWLGADIASAQDAQAVLG